VESAYVCGDNNTNASTIHLWNNFYHCYGFRIMIYIKENGEMIDTISERTENVLGFIGAFLGISFNVLVGLWLGGAF